MPHLSEDHRPAVLCRARDEMGRAAWTLSILCSDFGISLKRSGGTVVGDGPRGKWPLKEAQLRYSKLVRNDQLSCGNLADRWPLVSALPAVGMGGPSSAPSPPMLGRFSASREMKKAAN